MTLERHIIDTMKEWQVKIGSFDSDIRLYYPKESLCRYLGLDAAIGSPELIRYIEEYFAEKVQVLGNVGVSADRDRFCIVVREEGCAYVEKMVPEPEFLTGFLRVLKLQKMPEVLSYFEEFAAKNGTILHVGRDEDDGGTILYFEDEDAEPYVYCVDENAFGLTYHRFAQCDYL